MTGLVVVTFFIVGANVAIVTVVGTVLDDVVMKDDGSILSSDIAVSSNDDISVVNISAMLELIAVSVSRQAEVVNSSSLLVWIINPTFPWWAPLPNWDSSNSAVGLVTKVKSTSSIPVMLLLSESAVFCITSPIMDKVTSALAFLVAMANGIGVLGPVKKLLGVFTGTLGVVASTLVPVVRIVCSKVLYSVYEVLSLVVLIIVADGGLVVFKVKPGLLVLTLAIVSASSTGLVILVLVALQDLQQMRWNAGIMQYSWSIAILHTMERSLRHCEPITQQSESIRLGEQSRHQTYNLCIWIFASVFVYVRAENSEGNRIGESLFSNNNNGKQKIRISRHRIHIFDARLGLHLIKYTKENSFLVEIGT